MTAANLSLMAQQNISLAAQVNDAGLICEHIVCDYKDEETFQEFLKELSPTPEDLYLGEMFAVRALFACILFSISPCVTMEEFMKDGEA